MGYTEVRVKIEMSLGASGVGAVGTQICCNLSVGCAL